MNVYMLPLTVEESRDARNCGLAFALKNRDRWVDIEPIRESFNTYDKGTTVMVHEGAVYNIFKDYNDIQEGYRLYIGRNLNLDYDKIEEESDEDESTK